jgi:DNA repair exonuclease SbcCD ATPase subunit
MPEVSSQFERLFDKLFDLIRDSTTEIKKLVGAVTNYKESLNEFIHIIKHRPCFVVNAKEEYVDMQEKALKAIRETQNVLETETAEDKKVYIREHVKDLAASNIRLVKLLYVIFLTLITVNTSVFIMLIYFVHQNPRIWDIIEKMLTK